MKKITEKIAVGVAIFVAAVGVICIVVCLVAFGDKVSTEDIPQLSQLNSVYGTEEVVGSTREQLTAKWGEPDGMLSGFFGDMWEVNGNDRITAYYNDDETVMEISYIHFMKAKIMEKNGSTLLLEPCAGEPELKSADRITVGYSDIASDIAERLTEGVTVLVGYDGNIAESYPARITAKYGITIAES